MGRPAVFGAADASERASEMFLRTGAFFSSILSEFLKNLVALQWQGGELTYQGVYTMSFAKNNATQRYSNAIIRGIDSQAIELSG